MRTRTPVAPPPPPSPEELDRLDAELTSLKSKAKEGLANIVAAQASVPQDSPEPLPKEAASKMHKGFSTWSAMLDSPAGCAALRNITTEPDTGAEHRHHRHQSPPPPPIIVKVAYPIPAPKAPKAAPTNQVLHQPRATPAQIDNLLMQNGFDPAVINTSSLLLLEPTLWQVSSAIEGLKRAGDRVGNPGGYLYSAVRNMRSEGE